MRMCGYSARSEEEEEAFQRRISLIRAQKAGKKYVPPPSKNYAPDHEAILEKKRQEMGVGVPEKELDLDEVLDRLSRIEYKLNLLLKKHGISPASLRENSVRRR
jgi:hypothetical protein